MRKIIIDCDPGIDDALAIFLALASRNDIEVLGLTCVKGNVALDKTYLNAQRICAAAGRLDIPVLRGIARPILAPAGLGASVHGVDGLGDIDLPAAEGLPETGRNAVDFILKLAEKYPGEIALCAIGPMTNVAMAFVLEPRLAARVREIVVMGGARSEGGNITASAEYNIFADPHAAQVVFSSGAPITVFGLDATHQVRSTPQRISAIRVIGTPQAKASADLLAFSASVERNIPGITGAPLHDPCTIAYLLAPELFECLPCEVRVETNEGVALGHTAVEFRDAGKAATRWATKADSDGVFALLIDRLSR